MSDILHFPNSQLRGELHHQVVMSKHTSWRAGGVVDRLYQPADLADLQVFLRGVPLDEPLYVVGLGSNLLVRDGGLRGTVVLLHGVLKVLRLENDHSVYVEAGVPGAKLARFAAAHNLSGAAFFAGIPGTMGGMLAMNAGCYGSETWQHVSRVHVLTRSGELLQRTRQDYEIGYRTIGLRTETARVFPAQLRGCAPSCCVKDLGLSGAQGADADKARAALPQSSVLNSQSSQEFFVSASLEFSPGDGEVARQEIKELLGKRIASQPLNLPNAGSVFRNPSNDHAARLIERCGLKGKRIGGAQVSEKHANFIVNVGDATAADIENLIYEVRATVAVKTGVELHPEVRIIGEKK